MDKTSPVMGELQYLIVIKQDMSKAKFPFQNVLSPFSLMVMSLWY